MRLLRLSDIGRERNPELAGEVTLGREAFDPISLPGVVKVEWSADRCCYHKADDVEPVE